MRADRLGLFRKILLAHLNEPDSGLDRTYWRIWSTDHSVRAGEPSVMAVLETALAVAGYLWLAVHYLGFIIPLYFTTALAPLVLLRSDQSVALGASWFVTLEKKVLSGDRFWWAAALLPALMVIGLALKYPAGSDDFWIRILALPFVIIPLAILLIFLIAFAVRFLATAAHWRQGLRNLPRNFRVLVACTSPSQFPELVPGLEKTDSWFTLDSFRYGLNFPWENGSRRALFTTIFLLLLIPAWFFRITIKSAAWFWWPLVFLRADLNSQTNPKLLHFRLAGSLWAKTSILISVATLLTFIFTNLIFNDAILAGNPLLTPLGYLLVIDWTPQLWQISALAVSGLSLLLVYLVNSASGEYEIAVETGDKIALKAAERKFNRLQRVARLRLLFALVFWILVGMQSLLLLNWRKCWFEVPLKVEHWAEIIYGARLPPNDCPDLYRKK